MLRWTTATIYLRSECRFVTYIFVQYGALVSAHSSVALLKLKEAAALNGLF